MIRMGLVQAVLRLSARRAGAARAVSTRSSALSSARSQLSRSPVSQRQYATGVPDSASLPQIDPSKLRVTLSEKLGTPLPSSELKWGESFTDHMITVPWSATTGWGVPEIHPYRNLDLSPAAMGLHYALTVFEGMKAYRDEKGRVMLFRPDKNMERLNRSAKRVALPSFDGPAVVELIKQLVKLESRWIPSETGHSLYVRPVILATQKSLYVGATSEALLYVICSPVGPYYRGGFKPVSLLGTTNYIRAAPGGTGGFKVAVNYAPAIVPQLEAAEMGYDQNLWLLGPERYLTEVGSMNMFVVLKREDGAIELVTPPLDDIILPGVTRDSILTLAREHVSGTHPIPDLPPNLIVSERPITMSEVQRAAAQGRLLELFGAGTAAIVCPVERIGYEGEDIKVPTSEKGAGQITQVMWREIVGRQYGTIPSEWCVVVTP